MLFLVGSTVRHTPSKTDGVIVEQFVSQDGIPSAIVEGNSGLNVYPVHELVEYSFKKVAV